MKSVVLALTAVALLACCAHKYPTAPPTFGFYGRVSPQRPVKCVFDSAMDIDKCAAVAVAVRKINAAVGFELLLEPTAVSPGELLLAKSDTAATYVLIGKLPFGVLGLTGYAKRVAIVKFSPDIWDDPAMTAAVVLHEMLHSVGAAHSEQAGNFESVERPVYQPGGPTELTAGDVAAIRAAYVP